MMAAAETQTYAYNMRDELIFGQGNAHACDDIGNRTVAEGHVYGSNALNQYVAIDAFQPSYDLDGNQTLVRTSTGDWTVACNAENRPVSWTKGDTVVTMVYDRLGRRVECKEVVGGATVKHERFVYNGYTCVQRLRADGTVNQLFVWDPTEPVATRPLYMQVPDWGANLFYACDGNKNVSDVFYRANVNGIAAHYDYAPFGAVTRTARNTQVTHRNFIELNPWRFSSEFYDDTLGLVYYNYRHYNPLPGRWTSRDRVKSSSLYSFVNNRPCECCDLLGNDTLRLRRLYYEVFTIDDFISGAPRTADGDLMIGAVFSAPEVRILPVVTGSRLVSNTTCPSGNSCIVSFQYTLLSFRATRAELHLPQLSTESGFDRDRWNRFVRAVENHERMHVNALVRLNREYHNRYENQVWQGECESCTGLSTDERDKAWMDCITAHERELSVAIKKELDAEVHNQIGDSFDFQKVRSFLEGASDTFR